MLIIRDACDECYPRSAGDVYVTFGERMSIVSIVIPTVRVM